MDEYLKKEYISLEEKLGFYFGRLVSFPMVAPEHVYFSLTNRCNLRCKMCDIYKNPSREEDELTLSEVRDIICQIKDMGIRHLILSGGEPLLRDDLLEIVDFAVKKGIKMVDVITNGTLLKNEIIQQLIKAGLNHITVSLDGIGGVNDVIRGKGMFEKAEENIDKINYYKGKYKSKFPTVGINFTIMDSNIDEILPMIEFAKNKKCNIVVFQPILFNNTKMFEKESNILWPRRESISKMVKILDEVKMLKHKLDNLYIYTDDAILDVMSDYFKGKKLKGDFKCYEAIKRIVITYEGKVWSCMGIYGDLKRDSLRDIWFSDEAHRIREKVGKCRQHCLQDCVYFPSNILKEIHIFLKKIEKKDADELEERLIEKIECFVKECSSVLGKYSFNWVDTFKIKREISLMLKAIHKA